MTTSRSLTFALLTLGLFPRISVADVGPADNAAPPSRLDPLDFDASNVPANWCPLPNQLGVGDFNHDGYTDLYCHFWAAQTTWVALANKIVNPPLGHPHFQFLAPTLWISHWCIMGYSFGTADFDGDGKTDIWCHDPGGGYTWVAQSQSTYFAPNFAEQDGFCEYPTDTLFVGNFNNDTFPDIMCRNTASPGTVTIRLFNGTTFGNPIAITNFCPGTSQFGFADFDHANGMDIFCHTSDGTTTVALSTPNSGFGTPSAWSFNFCPTTQNSLHKFGVGDFNYDQAADIVCWDSLAGISVGLSTNHTSFVSGAAWAPPWCTFYSSGNTGWLAVNPGTDGAPYDDFNGDHKTDLECTETVSGVTGTGVYLSASTLSPSRFVSGGVWNNIFSPFGMQGGECPGAFGGDGQQVRGDFNGDHVTDVLCSNSVRTAVALSDDVTHNGQLTSPGAGVTYHGGTVITQPHLYVILYGPSWTPTQQTLIGNFLNDLSGSPWYTVLNQRYTGNGAPIIQPTFTTTIAKDPATGIDPKPWQLLDSLDQIINDTITAQHWIPDGNSLFVVMLSTDWTYPGYCVMGGECGHNQPGHFQCGFYGSQYLEAIIGNPGAVGPCGCNLVNQLTSPNGDPATDAMLSTLAHEFVEMITDGCNNGWYGSASQWSQPNTATQEADYCNLVYGMAATLSNSYYSNFSANGRKYLIQEQWVPVDDKTGFCSMTGSEGIP